MKRKKLGVLLLTLCMLVTMIPAAVNAESGSAPVTVNGEIYVTLPLDLDGKTPNDSKVSQISYKNPGSYETVTNRISSYDWKFYTADGKEMSGSDKFNDTETYKAAFSLKTSSTDEYILGENNTVMIRDYWGWYRNYTARAKTAKDEKGNTVIYAEFEFNLARRIVDCDFPIYAPRYADLIGTHPSDWSDALVYKNSSYRIPEGEIYTFDLMSGMPVPKFYTADGKEMADTDTFAAGESYIMRFSLKTLNPDYYILDGENEVFLADFPSAPSPQRAPVKVKTTVSKDQYNNTVVNAEYTYDANKKVSQIAISGISKKIAAGKKIKLTAKITPSDAVNQELKWKSSNTKVATVTQSGTVTMKAGSGGKTVTITAAAKDGSGVKAAYKIQSMKGEVKKITVSGLKSVKAGKTLTLKAKVTASKGANTGLKWKSSNTKYAVVSSTGKVTAKKAGKGKTVTITAQATDGTDFLLYEYSRRIK